MAVAGVLLSAPTEAADWRVTPDGPGIQAVVKHAAAGDRVLVSTGVYREHLLLTKPITLLGESGATIDGGGRGDVIRIRAPGVTVQGFTLRGAGHNLTQMNSVIFIEPRAARVSVEDNDIQSDAFGIWLDACKDARITANRIQGNIAFRSQDRGNGVHLYNTTGAVVRANEIWNTRDGIYIDSSNHNELLDNDIHHLRYGIHYMYAYHNRVSGNRTHHTRTGYALMQSRYLTVVNNRSENDQNYGILMNFIVNSTIADNIVQGVRRGTSPGFPGVGIAGAEGKAIFIYNSQFNDIHGNLLADSDLGIHLTAGSEDNTIYGNAFVGNRLQVKYVATRLQEWSQGGKGNYWSDYLGWDTNADGIGDLAYEPNDGIDRVLWKYPSARILMHSPAIQTLRWVQGQFPVLKAPGVKDSHPLITIPAPLGQGA